jgi:protoheme ferro-lyase
MKIALISLPRTGSTSISRYYKSINKDVMVIDEPFNLVVNNPTILYSNLIKNNNLFIKTMYGDNPLEFENMSAKEFILKLIDDFDLVLFLTRRNIKEHTESYVQALQTSKWASSYVYNSKFNILYNEVENKLNKLNLEMIETCNELKMPLYFYEDLYNPFKKEDIIEFLYTIGCNYDKEIFNKLLDVSKKYRVTPIYKTII